MSEAQRLRPDHLDHLDESVQRPAYDRAALRSGIVHLGLGAFHRAHQAVFTEQAICNSGGDWGITGVSMRSAAVAEQLNPQGGLYSVLSEDADSSRLRLIGAVREVLVAPQQPAEVVAAIAGTGTRIITLTITEKGYCLAADGVSLDRSDPVIAADLARPEQPCSAVGLLSLGLARRAQQGGAALTVISCDNLAENSRVLHGLLREYLATVFPATLSWFDASVAFPCSMVDRIVPAMDEEGRVRQAQLLGLRDEGAVATEPFNQWIIENRFLSERPDWESAGVQLVADIRPFEEIKLRLLNASHSAIACIGLLAGIETVDKVVGEPDLRAFVEQLMTRELMPELTAPEGFDLTAYRDSLLARFANPRLGHRCSQIAIDSSEKLRQRWLPGLQAGGGPLLHRALAGWCCFVLQSGLPVDDPRSGRLLKQRHSEAPLSERLAGVLDCIGVGPQAIPDYHCLLDELQLLMARVEADGVQAMLAG